MARYLPTIRTNNPETLDGLQPGQWIDYNGTRGRYMGRKEGTVWIAWGSTARKRFDRFALAYNVTKERKPIANPLREFSLVELVALIIGFSYALFILALLSGFVAPGATTFGELWHAIAPHWESFG